MTRSVNSFGLSPTNYDLSPYPPILHTLALIGLERMIPMQTMHFTVLGGDRRLCYTAEALRQAGHTVTKLAGDVRDVPDTPLLVLPVPLTRDGETLSAPSADKPMPLQTLVDILPQSAQVFCGLAGDAADLFYRRGIRLYDYAKRDEFSIRNAVPTAEGAAEILLRYLPSTVQRARILITGYGKTARACARLLGNMGALVTVAARRCSALAAADSAGYRALYLDEIYRFTDTFDAVVNTVPACVLGERELAGVRRDCPIVEIASAPYGVDMDAARRLGLSVHIAPSLPGKIAPKTAGIILADTVLNILREGNA